MAKVIGFDQATADKQADQKKADQRKLTTRHLTRRIHMVKDAKPLTYNFSRFQRAVMTFSMQGGVA